MASHTPQKRSPRLPVDVLHRVLDLIEGDADKFIKPDQRAYLSVEAFGPTPPPEPPDAKETLGKFRLLCKDFAEHGAKYLFAKVAIRFGREELKRLRDIASRQHLARNVQKFVYMVPYFYTRDNVEALRTEPHNRVFSAENVRHFRNKSNEYKSIIEIDFDKEVLVQAFNAFNNLHHVQISGRTGDGAHAHLHEHLRRPDVHLQHELDLQWEPACTRTMEAITEAWLSSRNDCGKLSINLMSPATALRLARSPLQSLSVLTQRLTSLVLHFDAKVFEMQPQALADMLNMTFRSAKGIETVHVGFPQGFPPLNPQVPDQLKLEDVFHDVKWERLRSFGIEGWKLYGDEIVAFVSRYRYQLTSLRLRDVRLRELKEEDGMGMWKDVLAWLRQNMERLEWVSLRRIGYTHWWETHHEQLGHEVHDDLPGAPSDDEADDEDFEEGHNHPDDDEDGQQTGPLNGIPPFALNQILNLHPLPPNLNLATLNINGQHQGANLNHDHFAENHDLESDHDLSDVDSHSHDGHSDPGPAPYNPLFPDTPATTVRGGSHFEFSKDQLFLMTADELGDNGEIVPDPQWRVWERWVVARRPW